MPWYGKQNPVIVTMNIFCDIYYSNPSIFDKPTMNIADLNGNCIADIKLNLK